MLPRNFLIVCKEATFGIYLAEDRSTEFLTKDVCLFSVFLPLSVHFEGSYRERKNGSPHQTIRAESCAIRALQISRHAPSALQPSTYWFGLYIQSNLPTCSILIFFLSLKKLTDLISVVNCFGLNTIYFLNTWRNLWEANYKSLLAVRIVYYIGIKKYSTVDFEKLNAFQRSKLYHIFFCQFFLQMMCSSDICDWFCPFLSNFLHPIFISFSSFVDSMPLPTKLLTTN